MGRKKYRTDHRADTRGDGLIGLPKVVHKSAAYRSLDLYGRAVLLEILSRFNGFNNGQIGCSVREIGEALGNQNYRRISKAIADCMQRGLLDIAADSIWKERKSRQYRLTFITSGKAPPYRAATNDYRSWKPQISVDPVSAEEGKSADPVSASQFPSADAVSAAKTSKPQKTAKVA